MKERMYNEFITITDKIGNYSKEGFKIKYDLNNNTFLVNFHNSKEYLIKIIDDNNEFYWYLEPYNNSHFTTSYDNGFDMLLFAIKENETIYK